MDGELASAGAPSLLQMTARRGLNVAYAKIVENLSKEDREQFESEINLSMVELTVLKLQREVHEKEDRKKLAASFGEVAN